LSVAQQCALLDLSRSSYYYQPVAVSAVDLSLMRWLDEQYTATPFYGSRRMQVALSGKAGYHVNRKQVQRLMRLMGLEAVGPKPRLSVPHPGHKVYPYLLRDVPITRVDQVWSTDITYVRLRHGFVYLVAVLDWFSRYVLAWDLSVTVDGQFCLDALDRALGQGTPEIFNTDQAPSSRPRRSPRGCRPPAPTSAWTGAAGRWTTCSASGCGGPSSTKRST
jgi:putative transposase